MIDTLTKKKQQLLLGEECKTKEQKLDILFLAKQKGYEGCIPDPLDSPFADTCIVSATNYLWDLWIEGRYKK